MSSELCDNISLPYRMLDRGCIESLSLPAALLKYPFVAESVARAAMLGQLRSLVEHYPARSPSLLRGIVLHPSRAGSTLLCRMLELAVDDTLVLKEPRWRSGEPSTFSQYQEALGRQLARTHWVKWPSEVLLERECSLMTARSPRTIFLIRDPAAIVSSNVQHWPTWACKALVSESRERRGTIEEFISSQVEQYFRRMVALKEEGRPVIVVTYDRLRRDPVAVVEEMLLKRLSAVQQRAIRRVARFDAKRPQATWRVLRRASAGRRKGTSTKIATELYELLAGDA